MEPEQREVVVLARLARLTVDEIAATLDIDAPTVKARMLGALRMAAEPAAVG